MSGGGVTLTWIKHPRRLQQAIAQHNQRVLVAVQAVAVYWGQGSQNAARASAPWTDRTGNARSGLFFAVDGFGLTPVVGRVTAAAHGRRGDVDIIAGDKNTLIITLGHTVYYGEFLELCNGGRYAVVMSTIESRKAELKRLLERLLGGR